ncbi:hypothetical protein [Comamonas sp. NLF-1-9]|uniref:hypothetical protein n=1 Tax=Comamonas sp. NLF-1-9 TaxID=2853163 RepID=UPI001C49130C|nr:hypothetical protein [Comamonas sp. NLF-1-9]QXL83853.1 hypothetical protein KUD94_11445 [Comamonas sp. NLF-1-9]
MGKRIEPRVGPAPSGDALALSMAFAEDLAGFTGGRVFFPKGVFRYRSHAQANAHQAACLALGMAKLARERAGG